LWGTVKISNCCYESCAFCRLRAGNSALPRHRLDADQVLGCARSAAKLGYRSVVLQSARDSQLSAGWLCDAIRRIKGETGLSVTLSMGERSEAELAAWRAAGADRYFLRFLTANTTLYRCCTPLPVMIRGGVCRC